MLNEIIKKDNPATKYIADLVDNNYKTFLDALTLLQKGQKNQGGVYTKIKSKIEHLNNVALTNSGHIMRPVGKIYEGDEWVKLGWGEYVKSPNSNDFNVILTDEGERIVNEYRASQGIGSLEDTLGESWKHDRAHYHSLSNLNF